MSNAVAEKTRNAAQVQADLDAARAKLKDLMPRVEADRRKVAIRRDKIAKAQAEWRVNRPEEPFDPHEFNPPLVPLEHEQPLHGDFHKAHYAIAGFEAELAAVKSGKGA